MRPWLPAFSAGALFAAGLGLSGMTDPAKVLGFLDVTGAWDPSLAFVMAGALSVYGVLRRLIRRRAQPVCAATFIEPRSETIDAKLLIGAGIFGVGWGLSGYCPGPALVSLASLETEVFVFVLAMVAGMALVRTRPEDGPTSC